jgi:hypothetical protein
MRRFGHLLQPAVHLTGIDRGVHLQLQLALRITSCRIETEYVVSSVQGRASQRRQRKNQNSHLFPQFSCLLCFCSIR